MRRDDRNGAVSRRLFLAGAAAALAAGPRPLRAQARPVVRIQAFAGGSTAIALKALEEGGFDRKHGFEVKAFYFSPSISYQQFLQRNTDVSFDTDPLVVAKARLEGHKIVGFFSCTNNHSAVLVKKDARFKSLDDLRGQKLGHYGIDTGGFSALTLVAAEKGIDVLKAFQLREAAPPALLPLLGKGEVDGIVSFEPLISKAAVTVGTRTLFGPFTRVWQEAVGKPLPLTVIAAFEDYVGPKVDHCRRVRDAWVDTARWIRERPDIIERESFQKLTGVKEPEAMALLKRAIVEIPMYMDSWEETRASTELAIERAVQLKLKGLSRNPGGTTTTLPA